MPRLLFEKTGNAVWMSHLDLMRVFQRGFKRAGLALTHTQGYNPRPSVSIALPLSVGVESVCELLDFDLDGEAVGCEEIKDRLNRALVSGVKVLKVYDNGSKLRELALLRCNVTMEYDGANAAAAADEIRALFNRTSLNVPKKSKSGIQEQDIVPMIRRIDVSVLDSGTLLLNALIFCQNPSLNPAQLAAAVAVHLPHLQPDHSRCKRIEIYDVNENIFR